MLGSQKLADRRRRPAASRGAPDGADRHARAGAGGGPIGRSAARHQPARASRRSDRTCRRDRVRADGIGRSDLWPAQDRRRHGAAERRAATACASRRRRCGTACSCCRRIASWKASSAISTCARTSSSSYDPAAAQSRPRAGRCRCIAVTARSEARPDDQPACADPAAGGAARVRRDARRPSASVARGPEDADHVTQRRQSAEGAVRARGAVAPQRAVPVRADTRRGRRRQGGNLRGDRRVRQRAASRSWSVRRKSANCCACASHLRPAKRPHRGAGRLSETTSEEDDPQADGRLRERR